MRERAFHTTKAVLAPSAWRVLAVALGLIVAMALAMPAQLALAAESLDLARTDCSISLELKDTSKKVVSGGTVQLYRVASIAGSSSAGYTFPYEEGFGAGESALTSEQVAGASTELAQTLAEQASQNGVSPLQTLTIGSGGSVSFGGLSTGVYLVVQSEPADGYKGFSPFVVTVPYEEELSDGTSTYVYDVDASPKVGDLTKVTNEPPSTEQPSSQKQTTHQAGEKLPQTGQLWWPVWVLLAGGGSLVLAGITSKAKSKRAYGSQA